MDKLWRYVGNVVIFVVVLVALIFVVSITFGHQPFWGWFTVE